MTDFVPLDGVDIKSMMMTSLDGSKSYDISAQCIEISVYEDITFPVVRAEFLMADAIDLLSSFPIIGEELITIEFGTPNQDITCKYVFHTKTVENQIINPNSRSKTYVIRACSPEFIMNSGLFIGKRFNGNSDGIVDSIFTTFFNSNKTLMKESTKGMQDILLSNIRPFQAIDMIRQRSVSSKYLSSSYLFFENKRGFNFCTIEYLLDQTEQNIKDKTFYYDPAGLSDVTNMNGRNIISFENVSQVNNTKKLAQGSLNNIVRRFDFLTGNVATTQYINADKESQFKYGTSNPASLNTSLFGSKYGSNAAVAYLLPHSSELPENYMDQALGPKHSFVTKMGQNIYNVYVNGDPVLTAGDVITINVPNAHGATGDIGDNRLITGNYLIAKLRHIIFNDRTGPASYTCSMSLIKGSYQDNA